MAGKYVVSKFLRTLSVKFADLIPILAPIVLSFHVFMWLRIIPCTNMEVLTHWGRVTYICVGKLTTIVSDNGLSLGRHQAIIWTSAGILIIAPLETNFSEILTEIDILSFKSLHLKMSPAKWCLFCLGLHVLNVALLISRTGYQIW